MMITRTRKKMKMKKKAGENRSSEDLLRENNNSQPKDRRLWCEAATVRNEN